jgi:hypothetical protein
LKIVVGLWILRKIRKKRDCQLIIKVKKKINRIEPKMFLVIKINKKAINKIRIPNNSETKDSLQIKVIKIVKI